MRTDGHGKGRSEGYYLSLIGHLRAHLESRRTGRKLTRIDVRLISAEIRGSTLFTDPYGSQKAAQDEALIDIILQRRGDLNPNTVRDFVENYVPKRKRRPPSN